MGRQLKSDLNELKRIFTENHERFRILKASSDEINCRFILKDGKFCDIQANITVMYPSTAPLWVVFNEDDSVTNALEALNNTKGHDNYIINQVKILLHQLCSLIDVPVPADLDNFVNAAKDQQISNLDCDIYTGNGSDEVSDDEDDEKSENSEDDPVDDEMLISDEDTSIDVENVIVIKKQIELQFQRAHVNQSSSKILLKELETIYRSDTYNKHKTYSIELIDESLYDWNVNLFSVCPDSLLSKDLAELKKAGGKDIIQMRVLFKKTYPFDPPFIQVTYPAITGGHVLVAGAICMELLTKQGWSSAYTMESVFMQISSTFITGNARVDFELTEALSNRPYSLEAAKRMFKHNEDHHAKNGWVTPADENS